MSHPATPTYGRREGIPRDSFSLTEAYSEKGFLDKLQGSSKTQHVTVDDITTAGKLLASLKGGSVACITYEQIQYKVGRDDNVRIGRYYPFVAKKGVVSYQTMRGSLRRIIMADKYVELDMKNAQPSNLEQLCARKAGRTQHSRHAVNIRPPPVIVLPSKLVDLVELHDRMC